LSSLHLYNDAGGFYFLLIRPSIVASLSACCYKTLGEFHQIYSIGAFEDKDELIIFWGHKVWGHGHDQTKYSDWQKSTCNAIFVTVEH